jgi:RNA polymerase sigma-70 factor (ECF subfamily)
MKNLSEKELVVLAQSGNERAISILFEKMRPKMMLHLSRKFSNVSAESREDAVQTSLLKAFMKIDKYNPTYSFNSWISKICVNTVIDSQRTSESKAIKLSIDSCVNSDEDAPTLGSLLTSNSLNPEEIIENSDKGEFILEVLMSGTNEKTLEIAQMRFLDQMSYKEISAKTGYPLGTVKTAMFRFRSSVDKISEEQKMTVR